MPERGRPKYLGVSGHQHLPPEAVDLLRAELDADFPHAEGLVVVCSLAAGADSIVAAALLRKGAALRVIVPCGRYEKAFQSPEAVEEYHRLLGRAAEVVVLPHEAPSEQAFLEAGYRVLDDCDGLLAVWDGRPPRGLGGTGDIVARARGAGKAVKVVWPAGVDRS